MSTVGIELFGPPRVCGHDGVRREARGAGAAVLGMLALATRRARPMSRDSLAFSLWPDRDEPSARRALNDALYRLRRSVGDIVVADATSVALQPKVEIDVVLFDLLAASNDPADWVRAIDLADAGEFLAGTDAEWADEVRRNTEHTVRRLLESAWAERRAAGAHAGALVLARRWARADPYGESAHQAVIEALARVDGADAALDYYHQLVVQLDDELGVEPDPETQALAEQLRNEVRLRAEQPGGGDSTRRFVGRVAERGRLVGLLDRAVAGSAGVALVLADAGMGKTRLLDEVAGAAGWRGFAVGRGRGQDVDRADGRGALIDALTALTPPLRRQQLADLVDDVWLRQLAVVAPVAGEPAGDGHVAEVHLAAVVGQTLGGLSRVTPLLVLLDDLHWASDETWSVLDSLRRQLGDARVLIVVAARQHELRERTTAWEQVQRWDGEGVPVIHLGGLSAEEIGELVGDDAEAERIHQRSGGNPLVALALDPVVLDSDTASTAGAIASERLQRLDAAARDVIAAAAVLGDEVDFATWRALVDDAELALTAGTLETAGLLAPTPSGYRFAHDTVREAMLAELDTAALTVLHRRAFDVVRERRPDDVAALLMHAEGTGDHDDIGHYAIENGVRALDHAAFSRATAMFTRALDVLDADDELARRAALLGRLRASKVLADRELQQADLDELIALVEGDGGLAHAEALRLLADHQLYTGRFAEVLDTLVAAEAALATVTPELAATAGTRAAIGLFRSMALRALGQIDEAEGWARRARDGFIAIGDVASAGSATDQLGGIAWSRSDFALAAELHAAAAALFAEVGAAASETRALNNLGSAQWGLGDIVGAAVTHERALRLCRALGDRQGEGDNVDNLGGVAWSMGDYHGAIERYSQALAIRREIDDPWGVSISLSNLGDAWRQLGEYERALQLFEESLEVNRAAGVVRNDANTRQSIGLTLVDCGRYAEALDVLDAAVAAHRELGDRANEMAALAGLVVAHLATGAQAAAGDAAAQLRALLQPGDRAELAQLVHLRCAQVCTASGDDVAAGEHLAAAAAFRSDGLAGLSPAEQAAALAAVPLHRETTAALASAATQVRVHLAPAGWRPGRSMSDGDRVAVTWTVVQPGDPPAGSAAGRRTVLERLLAEAAAAGAVATHDELADALGVSRRTVIRDLAARSGG